MSVSLCPTFGVGYQAFTVGGLPLNLGLIYTYIAGGTTPQATYTTSAGNVQNQNPIVLGADGRPPSEVWLTDGLSYRFDVTDSLGNLIKTYDNISSSLSSAALSASSGSALVGTVQTGAGATVETVEQALRKTVFVSSFLPVGYVTDGSVDYSAQVQDCIDAHKGKHIVFDVEVQFAGLLLSGSTYDGTELEFWKEMKFKADAGSTNFGGAWVGIILKECDRVRVAIKANGNRSAMTDNEHIFVVGIAGATNVEVVGNIREVRGDGCYVSQSDWTATSTNPRGVKIDLSVTNSADDGRNAVSIIAGSDIYIDLYSYKVGGTVGGVLQPGGLDIEPNETYQTVSDVRVNRCQVVSAGASGLAVLGVAITNDATRDWNTSRIDLNSFDVLNTAASGNPVFTRISDLYLNGNTKSSVSTAAIELDYLTRLTGEVRVRDTSIGVQVGSADWVEDFDLKVNVRGYSTAGLQAVGVRRGRFTGRIYGATSASNTFAIRTRSETRSLTQLSVIYAVDAPYDGSNVRAFRNEPTDTAAYTNCYVMNCDWTGYASFSVQCDAQIPTKNVLGRNFFTAQPANGAWVAGDFVQRSDPTIDGNSMLIYGWMRMTSGTGNVAGTDWRNARVSDVSPAT